MSYGFEIYDSNGNSSLSQNDLAIQFIDVFTVSQSSTGSKVYANNGFKGALVFASPVEPVGSDITSFTSANFKSTSSSVTTSSITINYSPGYQYGNSYDVYIYVYGY
jgi:hypothetical protein